MRFLLATVFLFFVSVVLGHAAQPSTGKITFIRPGDGGFLNIMPATIVIEGQRSLKVSGEESATVELPYGRYRFHVESPDPYDPSLKSPKWSTGVIEVVVGADRAEFIIEGAVTNDGYDHWQVTKRQPNQALQHNDPSCHAPCVRTCRASRGRG